MIKFNQKVPRAKFAFGDKVIVNWEEVECGTSKAVITGINFDYRRDNEIFYTVTEENGMQTDEIPEKMLDYDGCWIGNESADEWMESLNKVADRYVNSDERNKLIDAAIQAKNNSRPEIKD